MILIWFFQSNRVTEDFVDSLQTHWAGYSWWPAPVITLLAFWLMLNVNSDRRLICDDYRVGEILVNKELPVTPLSALTKRGDDASFSPSADAKFHRGIISGTSSYSSNKYVSVVQIVQAVDRNANCFTGRRPCNLHSSCCILTEKLPHTKNHHGVMQQPTERMSPR